MCLVPEGGRLGMISAVWMAACRCKSYHIIIQWGHLETAVRGEKQWMEKQRFPQQECNDSSSPAAFHQDRAVQQGLTEGWAEEGPSVDTETIHWSACLRTLLCFTHHHTALKHKFMWMQEPISFYFLLFFMRANFLLILNRFCRQCCQSQRWLMCGSWTMEQDVDRMNPTLFSSLKSISYKSSKYSHSTQIRYIEQIQVALMKWRCRLRRDCNMMSHRDPSVSLSQWEDTTHCTSSLCVTLLQCVRPCEKVSCSG